MDSQDHERHRNSMDGRGSLPRWLYLLLFLVLVRGLLWAAVVPVFQGDDEPVHFAHVYDFYMNGGLPWSTNRYYSTRTAQVRFLSDASRLQFRPELRRQFAANSLFGPNEAQIRGLKDKWDIDTQQYAFLSTVAHVQVYYWLVANVLRLLPSEDPLVQVYVLRLCSVLFAVLAVLFVYLAAWEVFARHSRWPVYVTVFFAFLPKFTFISSIIQLDAYCYPIISFYFWSLMRWTMRRMDRRAVIQLALALILVITTKLNAYFAYPLTILMLLILAVHERRVPWRDIKWLAVPTALVVVFYSTYPGFQGVLNVESAAFGAYNNTEILDTGWSLHNCLYLTRIILWRNLSGYWGTFGWDCIMYPERVNNFLRALLYASLVLSLVAVARRRNQIIPRRILLGMVGCVVILFGGMLFMNWISYARTGHYMGMGRQLFPSWFPISVCMVAGIPSLFTRRVADWLAQIICFCIIALNILSLLMFIMMKFHA